MSSFEETYQAYEDMVRRFLLRLCGNAGLAEELTQETFYQALRHWDDFRGEGSVSTWLCTIAKNLYYGCLRRPADIALDDAPEPRSPDIAEAIVDGDRMMAAHRMLHGLPEPFREVFTLRTFGDLSHRQIGSLFGKSEAWSRVTYYRARQLLCQMVKEEWNDEK